MNQKEGGQSPPTARGAVQPAEPDAATGRLGNRAGVMPVTLPARGDMASRLTRTAAITRSRKAPAPGASAAVVGVVFRALAWLRVLRWFVNHQHMVHTFVTNLRGPGERLEFNGAAVAAVIPISLTTGNVTVAFGVLSYAGTLTITVVADPGRLPDLRFLIAALQAELAACTGP